MSLATQSAAEAFATGNPNSLETAGEIQEFMTNAEFSTWASDVATEALAATCLMVGITNGSQLPTDRATFCSIAFQVSSKLADSGHRTLVLRITDSGQTQEGSSERIPVAHRSPLGSWSEVELFCKASDVQGDSKLLSEWLPNWKESFQLLLVDLGSLNSPMSRGAGRFCDGSYLLLGPTHCASQEWIMQQIAWHHRSGSTICGTLLAE